MPLWVRGMEWPPSLETRERSTEKEDVSHSRAGADSFARVSMSRGRARSPADDVVSAMLGTFVGAQMMLGNLDKG